MDERLDELLAGLARTPADRPLDHFEADVWRGIGAWRSQARTVSALAQVRTASVGLALAMGVAAGGVIAIAAPQPRAAFQGASDLAPSTLLEGGR